MFTQNKKFTYIELFAGIGGFRIAMEALGDSELVWGCDIDRPARCTYRCNFGQDQVLYTDITEAKTSFIPTHDILTAGFPCQDFSTLGAGTEGGQQGLEGDTGSLFFQVVRVLRDVQPKSWTTNIKQRRDHKKSDPRIRISRIHSAIQIYKQSLFSATI